MKPLNMRLLPSTMPLGVWFQLIRVSELGWEPAAFILSCPEGWIEADIPSHFPTRQVDWVSWRGFFFRRLDSAPGLRIVSAWASESHWETFKAEGRNFYSFSWNDCHISCQLQECLPPTHFGSPNWMDSLILIFTLTSQGLVGVGVLPLIAMCQNLCRRKCFQEQGWEPWALGF